MSPAPRLGTALFLAGMSALGQASGLKLLLFPELGALTSVLFSDPASRWARSPLLLVLTPTLAAVAGIVVSRQLDYGPLSVALAVGAGLLVLVSRVARAFLTGAGRAVGPDRDDDLLPLRGWLGPLVVFEAGALALGRLLGTHLVLYPPLLLPQPPLAFPLFVLAGGAWLVLVARFGQPRGRGLG